jgi:hypothetical protein
VTALATIIGRGLHSARPAAGVAGSLYYETDTTTMFRDSGSAWESVEGGGVTAHSALSGLTSGDDHTQYQKESEKDAASGYAGLDGSTLLTAAQLPVFVQSGASHAKGAVPDPGASAGTTKFLNEDGTWKVPAGGGSGLYTAYVLARDEKTAGTNGGNSSSTTWHTRTLNVLVDPSTIASLASNHVVLPAGTYRVHATAPGYRTDQQKLRIRDITNSVTKWVGTSLHCQSSDAQAAVAVLDGRFTLAGAASIELQHWIAIGQTAGLGIETGAGAGEIEVYATVEFWKE